MMNPEFDASISFGNALQNSVDGMNYMYQSPPILASTQTMFHPFATVSDMEPMYVHLPQFAGNRFSVCPPQALCAYEVSAAVAAKDAGMLGASSGVDTEVKSACSTADTADRLPDSPELEQARPRSMQMSQHFVVTPEFGQNELDKEVKNMANRPWNSRLGNRVAAAKNSDALQGFLPSMGSAGHRLGRCKPCAFAGTKGCTSGTDCRFCHLCEVGEKKRRQKEKRAHFTAVRHARQAQHAKENVQVDAQVVTASED
jgi:hypothetical protein